MLHLKTKSEKNQLLFVIGWGQNAKLQTPRQLNVSIDYPKKIVHQLVVYNFLSYRQVGSTMHDDSLYGNACLSCLLNSKKMDFIRTCWEARHPDSNTAETIVTRRWHTLAVQLTWASDKIKLQTTRCKLFNNLFHSYIELVTK